MLFMRKIGIITCEYVFKELTKNLKLLQKVKKGVKILVSKEEYCQQMSSLGSFSCLPSGFEA